MKLSLLHASSGLEKTRRQINTETYSNESNHRVGLSYFLTTSSSVDTKRSDYLFKLLLIGDSGVGKSCLLLRMIPTWIATSVPLVLTL
ncbi:hypothetical protein DY000_02037203 [Brassica cretica]|uniref:Uncharacterized protein n=1 Tax=Brassica cretica TaxID=69181 RepID=A0ABQ7BE75_BRACR|nr:hypothetical protein DY000_02037203 [Brassica cretica]